MKYFPINLDLKGRKVVVIGGGEVASRKVESLLEAGAEVVVVAPEICEAIVGARHALPLHKKRGYQSGDLKGAFLAIAATNDSELHEQIRKEATDEGVLLNVVDEPRLCDFTFPAKVNRGEFLVTVSTGGSSPALSKKIRKDLEKMFGEEYGELVDLLGKVRAAIPKGQLGDYKNRFEEFVNSPALEMIRKKDHGDVQKLIDKYFGKLGEL